MAYNIPTRRIAAGAGPGGLNLQILPLHERLDFNASAMQPGDLVFVLVDVWTTLNGTWDVGAQPAPYGIEQWARTDYLFPPNHPRYNPSGGGDHNSFVLCFNPLGNPYADAGFVWTPNGAQHLQPPQDETQVVVRTPEGPHGWANIPVFNNIPRSVERGVDEALPPIVPTPEELAIYGNLIFDDTKAVSIPGWSVAKFGMADILQGIGLPNNWHVSTFAVWRAMTWRDYSGGVTPPPPGPGPDPVEPALTDLELAVELAVPMMAGTRAAATIATRALEVLALLKAGTDA